MPANIRAGKATKLPPPATALSAPPSTPATKRNTYVWISKQQMYHSRMQNCPFQPTPITLCTARRLSESEGTHANHLCIVVVSDAVGGLVERATNERRPTESVRRRRTTTAEFLGRRMGSHVARQSAWRNPAWHEQRPPRA